MYLYQQTGLSVMIISLLPLNTSPADMAMFIWSRQHASETEIADARDSPIHAQVSQIFL